MTKIYGFTTGNLIAEYSGIVGFAINKGDVINIDGTQYTVYKKEYKMITMDGKVISAEKELYVLEKGNHCYH